MNNTINLNNSECIREVQGFFTKDIYNICTGDIVTLPSDIKDYLLFGVLLALILCIAAVVYFTLKDT